MKSFKQFLIETPWVNSDELDIPPTEKRKFLRKETMGENDTIISKTPSGHTITKKSINYYDPMEGHDQYEYSAYGPDGKKDLSLKVHQKGNKAYVIDLSSNEGNTMKSHEFYHHLIAHHGIHLHSDYEQSSGGMKTWKKLHQMPGIHVQSYNGSTEKYSELKPSFQRKYDMDSSTRLAAKKKT